MMGRMALSIGLPGRSAASPGSPPLRQAQNAGHLGVLSVHLDGSVCRVGCEFCYLGARDEGPADSPSRVTPGLPSGLSDKNAQLLDELLGRLSLAYDEVAVALSEPAQTAAPALDRIVARARAHGKPVSVTTTLSVASAYPALFSGVSRLNLSVDPRRGRSGQSGLRRWPTRCGDGSSRRSTWSCW